MSGLKFLIAAAALVAPAAFAQGTIPAAAAAAGPAAPARVAGKVVFVEGEARLLDSAGRARRAGVGDRAYEGHTLVTAPGAEVHLAMEDGGYIGVRPDTEMRIDLFRA